jgi:hypothetical protein
MSDVTTTTGTENVQSNLEINVDQHLKFGAISDMAYMSSVEFCELVSKAFKRIFVDFEGCRLVPIPSTNQLQMQFYFNHKELPVTEGMYRACTKDGKTEAANSTLAAIRRRDHLLNVGDRYFLTDDGKSGLKKFFFDGQTVFEKDGSVKWQKIVAEVSDPATGFMSNPIPQQLTQVSFIDPVKIAMLLFGDVDDDGVNWVYNITPKRSMPMMGMGGNNNGSYILSIERISVDQTKKLAATYGLVFTNGLGIIK